MEKLDLKKTLKALYAPSAKEPSMVEVPPMSCFAIDGQGDPNTSQATGHRPQATGYRRQATGHRPQ